MAEEREGALLRVAPSAFVTFRTRGAQVSEGRAIEMTIERATAAVTVMCLDVGMHCARGAFRHLSPSRRSAQAPTATFFLLSRWWLPTRSCTTTPRPGAAAPPPTPGRWCGRTLGEAAVVGWMGESMPF